MRAAVLLIVLVAATGSVKTVPLEGMENPSSSASPVPSPLTATLGPGESRAVSIPLQRGQFIHLEALQPGARLTIRLFAPDGTSLAENGNPTEDDEPLPLSAVASADGTHTLSVTLDQGARGPVSITIVLESPRQTRAGDTDRIAAERLFTEGQRRRAEGTKEALLAALALNGEAAQKARSGGDPPREAYARSERAEIHWMLGDLRSAHEESLQAVAQWRALGRT